MGSNGKNEGCDLTVPLCFPIYWPFEVHEQPPSIIKVPFLVLYARYAFVFFVGNTAPNASPFLPCHACHYERSESGEADRLRVSPLASRLLTAPWRQITWYRLRLWRPTRRRSLY